MLRQDVPYKREHKKKLEIFLEQKAEPSQSDLNTLDIGMVIYMQVHASMGISAQQKSFYPSCYWH
jgi:hypothetical protein